MSLPTQLKSLEIETPDGTAQAHLANPIGEGKYPGVLYLMDAFGVRDVIDEWIQRIAGEGYVVLAPNLFYRNKPIPVVEDMSAAMDPEKRGALFQGIMPMMGALTTQNLAKDGKAYLDALAAQPETAPGPMALTGYCLGARVAIKIAASQADRVAAVAGFHGGNLVTDNEESPHLEAPKIKGEVYLAYADHDNGATPEQQQQLDQVFAESGVKHASEVYKDAPHGYTMRDTAAYQQEAAERHFSRLKELLGRTLTA